MKPLGDTALRCPPRARLGVPPWVGVALAVSAFLCVTPAHADDKAEAEKRFRAGVALQKVEDFPAAVAEFEASLALFPTKSALFNLANSLRATHRYAEALSALERLTREYGAELDAPMRARAEALREELEELTGTLLVLVDREGATVTVDGAPVGVSPLTEPIRLSVGTHVVEVTLAGFEPLRLEAELGSREQRTTTVELRATPLPPPPPPPAPPEPPTAPAPAPLAPAPEAESSRGSRTTGWVTLGTGLALVGAGTATGIWALRLDGDLAASCEDGHCADDRRGDIARLERLTRTTNALLLVGAVAAGTGVTLVLVDPHHRRRAGGARLEVVTSPGYVGTALGGSF